MSTTFEIIKFQKPTMKELLVVDRFQPYDSYCILDEDSDDTGYGIYLFRMDDKSVCFAKAEIPFLILKRSAENVLIEMY